MGCCARQVGLWLDERRLEVASCWLDTGHRWECHDRLRDLRWQPGAGVDATGVRYLIDLSDLSTDDREQLLAPQAATLDLAG